MTRDYTQEIIAAGRFLDAKGWAPATSGNYSMRIEPGKIAITASGRQKGELKPDDILEADLHAHTTDGRKASAEALLHTAIYRLFPAAGAVLHTHSVASVVLSRLMAENSCLELSGYEMLKAFPSITTHDTTVRIPIFENTQDMAALSTEVSLAMPAYPLSPAFIIRGHGVYGWGHTMAEARRVIEALEYLLECELRQR